LCWPAPLAAIRNDFGTVRAYGNGIKAFGGTFSLVTP
jgi:hypothetical protein